MKLTTITQVSVDGVMQGHGGRGGGPQERIRARRMGHALFDSEARTFMDQIYQRADAFLFGRRTYEIFAGSWGAIEEIRAQPDRGGVEHAAQVRRIDHAHRPAVGGHDRPVR